MQSYYLLLFTAYLSNLERFGVDLKGSDEQMTNVVVKLSLDHNLPGSESFISPNQLSGAGKVIPFKSFSHELAGLGAQTGDKVLE